MTASSLSGRFRRSLVDGRFVPGRFVARTVIVGTILAAIVAPSLLQAQNAPANLPGAAVTVMNPLYLRYQGVVPDVVHIEITDTEDSWTSYIENNRLKHVSGKFLEPMRIYRLTSAELGEIYDIVQDGRITFAEKMALIPKMIDACNIPLPPPDWSAGVDGIRLTHWENKMLRIGRVNERLRDYLRRASSADSEASKILWGGLAVVTKTYLGILLDKANDELWEEIDAALDRGDESFPAGSRFDLLINIIGIHLGFRSLDFTSWNPIMETAIQRLNAEMLSLPDYPPDQQERRKKAIESFLVPAKTLKDLLDET